MGKLCCDRLCTCFLFHFAACALFPGEGVPSGCPVHMGLVCVRACCVCACTLHSFTWGIPFNVCNYMYGFVCE